MKITKKDDLFKDVEHSRSARVEQRISKLENNSIINSVSIIILGISISLLAWFF